MAFASPVERSWTSAPLSVTAVSRWLVSTTGSWGVMRLFTLEPEAESSIHSHPWPHWFMCIQGEGYFLIGKERVPQEFGTWVHVPAGVRHNFGNTGEGQLMGLCIVPPEGDVNPLNGC